MVGVLLAMVWINVDEESYHAVTHEAIIDGWQIFGHDVTRCSFRLCLKVVKNGVQSHIISHNSIYHIKNQTYYNLLLDIVCSLM